MRTIWPYAQLCAVERFRSLPGEWTCNNSYVRLCLHVAQQVRYCECTVSDFRQILKSWTSCSIATNERRSPDPDGCISTRRNARAEKKACTLIYMYIKTTPAVKTLIKNPPLRRVSKSYHRYGAANPEFLSFSTATAASCLSRAVSFFSPGCSFQGRRRVHAVTDAR